MAERRTLTEEFIGTANKLAGSRLRHFGSRDFLVPAEPDQPEQVADIRVHRSGLLRRNIEYVRMLLRDRDPINPGGAIEEFPSQEIVYLAPGKKGETSHLVSESGVSIREVGEPGIVYQSGIAHDVKNLDALGDMALTENRRPTASEITNAIPNLRASLAGATQATESDLLDVNGLLTSIRPRRDELSVSTLQTLNSDTVPRTRNERRVWRRTLGK